MSERIVLLGASGQLGSQLQRSIPEAVELHAFTSRQLDIRDQAGLAKVFNEIDPAAIINAAAYTQVDKAEENREVAEAVNAHGPERLAEVCDKTCRIIHLSTDFVFDGKTSVPYKPNDKTNPLSVYGRTKLAGENTLLKIRPDSLIIRTSWLYGGAGQNFVNSMLRLMTEREELAVVNDQRGTPTSVRSLAEVVWRFVGSKRCQGIYHWSDRGEATWYDFACEIQKQAQALGLLQKKIPVRAIMSGEYPTLAWRPAYSVLDKTSTYEALAYKGRNWQDELQDVLALKAQKS